MVRLFRAFRRMANRTRRITARHLLGDGNTKKVDVVQVAESGRKRILHHIRSNCLHEVSLDGAQSDMEEPPGASPHDAQPQTGQQTAELGEAEQPHRPEHTQAHGHRVIDHIHTVICGKYKHRLPESEKKDTFIRSHSLRGGGFTCPGVLEFPSLAANQEKGQKQPCKLFYESQRRASGVKKPCTAGAAADEDDGRR